MRRRFWISLKKCSSTTARIHAALSFGQPSGGAVEGRKYYVYRKLRGFGAVSMGKTGVLT